MTFPVAPEQFAALTKTLCTTPGVQLRPANPLAGTISNHDVTLSYAYDGTAALTVDITALHSVKAKMFGESVIQSKIAEMLKNAE